MTKPILKTLSVLLLGIMPYLAYAEVPSTITFQGYLLDEESRPVEGESTIAFSIPGTGWTEHHPVQITQGVFSVVLGEQMGFEEFVDFTLMPCVLSLTRLCKQSLCPVSLMLFMPKRLNKPL